MQCGGEEGGGGEAGGVDGVGVGPVDFTMRSSSQAETEAAINSIDNGLEMVIISRRFLV